MLTLSAITPRKFISPLLSKKSITTEELLRFTDTSQNYLEALQHQSEPNSEALIQVVMREEFNI